MPDVTRPTSSRFFRLVKSVLNLDSSLKRIIDHPGGENLNVIFAYITSVAYDKLMHTSNHEGRSGLDVFGNEKWLTPHEFLKGLDWGGKDQITKYAEFCTNLLFNSLVQDNVMEVRGEYPNQQYKLIDKLGYPSDEQLNKARQSNMYFMLAMDDLLDYLPQTLEEGKPVVSRSKSAFLPLWEALLNDPLSDIFRSEMLYQARQNFPILKDQNELHILELGCGTGTATVRLIRDLAEHYEEIDIIIYCYEEIGNQLRRARERVQQFDKELKSVFAERNLGFQYQFTAKSFKHPITLPENSVDMILSFQHLHYLKKGELYDYFENLSRLLSEDGLIVVSQTTSHSEDFPHPMTPSYLPVKGFEGYPTVDQMREIISTLFKSYKSSGIDSIWTLKHPKYYS